MFSVFSKNPIDNNDVLTSNYAKGNKFTLAIFKNFFYTDNYFGSWLENNIHGFTTINLEPFSYSFSTEWEDGPGGKLVNMIQKFTRVTDGTNSLTNIFAGAELMSNPATDNLTQKIAKSSQQLSATLKFRVHLFGNSVIPLSSSDKQLSGGFEEDLSSKCSYNDIIYFLTCLTSAPTKFSWKTELENAKKRIWGRTIYITCCS